MSLIKIQTFSKWRFLPLHENELWEGIERKDTERVHLCECLCSLFLSIRSRCRSYSAEMLGSRKVNSSYLAGCLHKLFPSHTVRVALRFSKKWQQSNFFYSIGEWQPHGCFYWQCLIPTSCTQYNCSQWLVTKSPGLGDCLILTALGTHTIPIADELSRKVSVQEPSLFLEKEEKRSNSR